MEFQLYNKIEEIKCLDCQEPSLLTIDIDKFELSNCIKGHITSTYIEFFRDSLFKKTISISNYCSNCFLQINELSNNYKCLSYNKLFCNNCIKEHKQNKNHQNYNIFINSGLLCYNHKFKYKFICNDCKVNICDKYVKSHKNHNIQSLLDVIPNKNAKEKMNNKIKKNKERIEKLNSLIILIIEEINERFKKIKAYLSFLVEVCEYLLKKFNYSNYNYHNYKNYNYFYNYIVNEGNIKIDNYLNYIINGKSLSNNNYNSKKESLILKNQVSLPNNNLKNKLLNPIVKNEISQYEINNLIYFKDNIFISFKQENGLETKINLYEYKDYSFNYLSSYPFKHYIQIKVLKKSNYLNYLFIICEKIPKVIILDYDPIQKILILNKLMETENLRIISLM